MRFSDDLKVLINKHPSQRWLINTVITRIKEELSKIRVDVNEKKTQVAYLHNGDKLAFLGFDIIRTKSLQGKWFPLATPKMSARTKVIRKMKDLFKKHCSKNISDVIGLINPIIRGWVNYFRYGNSSKCFAYLRYWIHYKIRKHMQRSSKRKGVGWNDGVRILCLP